MLKPSPAYAHLTAATDEAAMKPVFEAELSKVWGRPVEIENFFIPRVSPKGNGRFLIQYRFSTREEAGGKNWIFFGRLLASGEMVPPFAQKPDAFFVSDIRLVVPVFPYDRKLKILPQFFPPANPSRLLQSLFSMHLNGTAKIERVEVLGYRLERRSLLSMTIQEKNRTIQIVAKLVRPEKAAEIFNTVRELENTGFNQQADDPITVPHPISHSVEGIVWLEKIDEPSLHDLIGTGAFVSGCQAAGRTLNKLHTATLKNLSPYTVKEEWKRLKEMILETAQIYPALAGHLTDTFIQLNRDVPVLKKEELTPVHRDFYDKQLLVGPKRITLIDTDTLALGDPALDVGNFLAHLFLRSKQHAFPKEEFEKAKTAFVQEYQIKNVSAAGAKFWKRVARWEAMTLLRLACLYSLRPRWRDLASILLDKTKKSINQVGEKDV